MAKVVGYVTMKPRVRVTCHCDPYLVIQRHTGIQTYQPLIPIHIYRTCTKPTSIELLTQQNIIQRLNYNIII